MEILGLSKRGNPYSYVLLSTSKCTLAAQSASHFVGQSRAAIKSASGYVTNSLISNDAAFH